MLSQVLQLQRLSKPGSLAALGRAKCGHELQNPGAVQVCVEWAGRALRGRVALRVKGILGPAKRRGSGRGDLCAKRKPGRAATRGLVLRVSGGQWWAAVASSRLRCGKRRRNFPALFWTVTPNCLRLLAPETRPSTIIHGAKTRPAEAMASPQSSSWN
jgi:hypothetical protein